MKRYLSVILIFIGIASHLGAKTHIRIHLGEEISQFPTEEVKNINFTDEGIEIETGSVSMPVKYEAIDHIDFGDYIDEAAVGEILSDENSLQFDGKILTGPINSEIRVYDLSGKLLLKYVGTVDMSALPDGVYVATSNGESIKILKK